MNKNDYKEFCKFLKQYSKDVYDGIEEIIDIYALKVQKEAKTNAPVDTGHLRRNIIIKKEKNLTSKVISDAEYGTAVEFGTSHNRPKPYLIPAFDKYEEDYVKECEKILAELFK